MPSTILGFVLRWCAIRRLWPSSVLVFLLSAAPLELQRRVVNVLVDRGAFETVLRLAAAYVGVVLSEQSLKLCLNVYRGWVAENRCAACEPGRGVCRPGHARRHRRGSRRRDFHGPRGGRTHRRIHRRQPVRAVAAGRRLASVIVYMLYLDWRLALLGLAFFVPQVVFVPLLQRAINRRAQSRILVKRGISGGLVSRLSRTRPDAGGVSDGAGRRIRSSACSRSTWASTSSSSR